MQNISSVGDIRFAREGAPAAPASRVLAKLLETQDLVESIFSGLKRDDVDCTHASSPSTMLSSILAEYLKIREQALTFLEAASSARAGMLQLEASALAFTPARHLTLELNTGQGQPGSERTPDPVLCAPLFQMPRALAEEPSHCAAQDAVPDAPLEPSVAVCCPICAGDDMPLLTSGCGSSSGSAHAACFPCSLRHVRLELTPGAQRVRCPQCLADGLNGDMSEETLAAVAAWSRQPGREDATGAMRPLPEGPLFHAALAESDRPHASSGDDASDGIGMAEEAVLSGEHKQCPGCGIGILRERGHHCHHVAPGTGCPGCGTHFCYACLHAYDEGDDMHHCPNGCQVSALAPQPRAKLRLLLRLAHVFHRNAVPPLQLFCWEGCDCPDCTECRPGSPCDNCDNDGTCWVCQPDNRPSYM